MKNNKELIDFILSLKDLKIEYKPRLKHYVISKKVKGRLVTGWDVVNHVKFMYETMKMKKMLLNDYSFQVLEKSVIIFE